MKAGLVTFSVVSVVAWAVLFYLSAQAVAAMGVNAAGPVFLDQFSHPWRAQFGADFSIHLARGSLDDLEITVLDHRHRLRPSRR